MKTELESYGTHLGDGSCHQACHTVREMGGGRGNGRGMRKWEGDEEMGGG